MVRLLDSAAAMLYTQSVFMPAVRHEALAKIAEQPRRLPQSLSESKARHGKLRKTLFPILSNTYGRDNPQRPQWLPSV